MMLYIGLNNGSKIDIINNYIAKNAIKKVLVFSHVALNTDAINAPVEVFKWDECCTIKGSKTYKEPTWYRLCSELNSNYLIVINEYMRVTHRGHVNYNALFEYQLRTPHNLTFNYLPILEGVEDLAILFRFTTGNNIKGLQLSELEVPPFEIERKQIKIKPLFVMTNSKLIEKHERIKQELITEAENNVSFDPDNIPRRIYKAFDKERMSTLSHANNIIVGREKGCIGFDSLLNTDDFTVASAPYTANQFTLIASLHLTGVMPWVMLNLKCDNYYLNKHNQTIEGIEKAYDYLDSNLR